METLFTWVHLSDIHVGHGDAAHVEDQKLVLDALREDIVRSLPEGAPRPDAIFVTGDIAFSGAVRSDDEYRRAKELLLAIAEAVGLSAEAVFVVPGNHDVQRPADSPAMAGALLRELREGRMLLDKALADTGAVAQLSARQRNYHAFAREFAPSCVASGEALEAQLYWRHILPIRGGLRLRLIGLNTALLAADESGFGSDKGRLWLGMRQITSAFTDPKAAQDEVVIVLSHHPLLGGWLGDETDAKQWIHSMAHIHLAGHVHDMGCEAIRGGGGTDFISIVAGAVHGDRAQAGSPARHGYSFGALIEDGGTLKVRVWPKLWSTRNRDFRPDPDNVRRGADFTEHPIPRVQLRTRTPAPGVPVRAATVPASAAVPASLSTAPPTAGSLPERLETSRPPSAETDDGSVAGDDSAAMTQQNEARVLVPAISLHTPLEKLYNDRRVLSIPGPSFHLCFGTVWAVSGRNSTGKTTLLRILAGALQPSTGDVVPSHGDATARRIDPVRDTAFVPQQPERFDGTVRSYLSLLGPGEE